MRSATAKLENAAGVSDRRLLQIQMRQSEEPEQARHGWTMHPWFSLADYSYYSGNLPQILITVRFNQC